MNCRRIEKLIPLYVEGDLGVDEAGAVLSHVVACARCNNLVAEYEQSQRWLRSYTPPDFDDASLRDLKLGVLREIEGRRARVTFLDSLAGRWTPRLVIAASAAFLIILAALAFHVYRQKTNEAPGRDDLAGGGAGQEK
ncbi:MAG TPA: zf-HC2 domain-containing protein, partial [Blastocatellia bacterium]|nr:zf-HC2 domain-containing protein [Blastocatellia bacterium]